jgi:hypothetical protein
MEINKKYIPNIILVLSILFFSLLIKEYIGSNNCETTIINNTIIKEINETKLIYPDRPIRFCDDEVVWISCIGNSMIPYSYQEPKSFIKYRNDIKLEVGETIIYNHPLENKTVHHTIYSINNNTIKTFGYNNNWLDDYNITTNDINYVGCISK